MGYIELEQIKRYVIDKYAGEFWWEEVKEDKVIYLEGRRYK